MAEVWIPPKLQVLTAGNQQVQVEGSTVRRLINNLEEQHPGIKEYLVDDEEDDLIPGLAVICLLYTSPSPRDRTRSRMPSSA